MLIQRIRMGETLYIVRYTLKSGMFPDPWGDDPGCPPEVNIDTISPAASHNVWSYCQGWLESHHEIHDDHMEECRADYERTGGDDD
jgi:hypothetical protein